MRSSSISINLAFPLRSLANPLAAKGSAVWRGQSVTFALRIDQPSALFGGAESEASLKLAAALMTLDFSGRVEGPPSARLAGLVDLRTPISTSARAVDGIADHL